MTGNSNALPTLHCFVVWTSGKSMEICSLELPGLFLPPFSALNPGSERFSHNIFLVQCVEGYKYVKAIKPPRLFGWKVGGLPASPQTGVTWPI